MKIVQYPHPALRHPAKPVTHIDKGLRLKVGEMFELMYQAKGLGLAATQVALPYDLLVMNMQADPQQQDAERVYFNPVIRKRKGTVEEEEGCLSFPGLYAKVRRARKVEVEAYDLDGNKVSIQAEELEARAWQHEIDHLRGVVFIDRFSSVVKLARHGEIKALESRFRKAQDLGETPSDEEIKELLCALELEMVEKSGGQGSG